jgi:signal peptidase
MSPIMSITIWLICSLSFLILLFSFKNGRKERLKDKWLRLERSGRYRRKKAYTKDYLRQLRAKMIKPKTTRALIPLFIMLFIVFLLVNNFVFFAVITSDSMSPTFNKGDMVLMTEFTDVDSGDIIMFSVPEEQFPIVHRVSNIQGENISTKGDFNYKDDLWTINNSNIRSEAVTINGKPIVLKGVGTYFIDEQDDHGRYTQEIEFNRLILTGMKDIAIFIFFITIFLYLFLTARESRQRKVS